MSNKEHLKEGEFIVGTIVKRSGREVQILFNRSVDVVNFSPLEAITFGERLIEEGRKAIRIKKI